MSDGLKIDIVNQKNFNKQDKIIKVLVDLYATDMIVR